MSDAPQLPISSSSSSSSSTVTSLMPSLSSQSTSNTSTQSQSQSQKASPSTATTSIPPPQPHPYNATSSYNATNRVQQSNPLSPPAMTSPCFVHSYLDQAVDLTRKQKRSNSSRRSNLNNQISDDVMTPHPTNNRNDSNPNSSYFNTQHEVQSGQSPFRSYDSNQQSHPSASTSSNRRTSSHTNNKEDHSSSSTSTSADRAARDASSRSKSWSRGIRGAADSGSDEERNNRNHRNSSARRDSTDDSTDENEDVKGSGSGSGSSSGSDTYSRGSSFTLSSGEEDEDEDRVRSLTRQLAETAVGVREMSKQLGECSAVEIRNGGFKTESKHRTHFAFPLSLLSRSSKSQIQHSFSPHHHQSKRQSSNQVDKRVGSMVDVDTKKWKRHWFDSLRRFSTSIIQEIRFRRH